MIPVFVGTDDIHEKAEQVLALSIQKHTSQPVNITFMRPGWKSGCTGFTNHRFLVPSLCGYRGFAIYLDVDMLVLGDIAELYSNRRPGAWCTTPMRDDVSVIDCAAFEFLTPELCKSASKNVIRDMIGNRRSQCIPEEWNTIDRLTPEAKLIHYSDLDTQPWHPIPGHNYKSHRDDQAVELFWQYYAETQDYE